MQDPRNKDLTTAPLCSIFQNGHNIESHVEEFIQHRHLTAWDDQELMDYVFGEV